MLANSLVATYNGSPVTLNRLTFDGFTSSFGATVGNVDHFLEIKHAFPKAGKVGTEQHLVKYTVTEYDTVDGVLTIVAQFSAHTVLKTSIGAEVDAKISNVFGALKSVLTEGNLDVILQRRV